MASVQENYSDKWDTWGAYCFQNWILSPICYLNRQSVEQVVEAEAKKICAPCAALQSQFDYSLMPDAKYKTHVLKTKGPEPTVSIFYSHGGAYIMNFVDDWHFNPMGQLMEEFGPCEIYFPEYTLAPHHTHETMFPTVEAVYRQLVAAKPNNKIVIMGESAGGGMTLILAQRLAEAKRKGDTVKQPDCAILLTPWLDVSTSMPEQANIAGVVDPILTLPLLQGSGKLVAGGPEPVDLKDPKVSPIYGSLDDLPPVTCFGCTHDTLITDSRRLVERFKKESPVGKLRYYEKKALLHVFAAANSAAIKERNEQIISAIKEDCGL